VVKETKLAIFNKSNWRNSI